MVALEVRSVARMLDHILTQFHSDLTMHSKECLIHNKSKPSSSPQSVIPLSYNDRR
jgi:hypothetical protein